MKWDARYLVDIQAIDDEHKQLFEIVNRLISARSDASDLTHIFEILNELTLFATKHFETEEDFIIYSI